MDPSAGPTITAAVASFTNAAWQYAAQSTLADYFTIFAVYVFLDNRRHDSPTPDDTDLSTTKNSLSIIILFAELCRYFLPPKYVWNDHDAAPADDLIINVASEVIPSVLPIIAAFCNLILLGFEPLHNRVPSMLPTVALTTTFAFRIARYFAFESPLQSYYTDLSLVLLSLQFCLLAIQLFWKVFICTPFTTTGQEPQLPVWRKIVPNWLGTMLMLPHLEIDALEQLDALYAPPMAYGSRPLFRQLAPLYDSKHLPHLQPNCEWLLQVPYIPDSCTQTSFIRPSRRNKSHGAFWLFSSTPSILLHHPLAPYHDCIHVCSALPRPGYRHSCRTETQRPRYLQDCRIDRLSLWR